MSQVETDEEVWPLVPPICQALTAYLATLINSPLDWVPHLFFVFSLLYLIVISRFLGQIP